MFETGPGSRDIFSICFNVKVFCVFIEYTQYTIFNIKRKIGLNYLKSASMGFFPGDSSTSSKQPW